MTPQHDGKPLVEGPRLKHNEQWERMSFSLVITKSGTMLVTLPGIFMLAAEKLDAQGKRKTCRSHLPCRRT